MKIKNITLAVSEDVYNSARVRAAEQGTCISKMASDYLSSLMDAPAEFERLERQQRLVQQRIGPFRAADRITREEPNDRAVH